MPDEPCIVTLTMGRQREGGTDALLTCGDVTIDVTGWREIAPGVFRFHVLRRARWEVWLGKIKADWHAATGEKVA